jgi:uracil-DNA glycosylase
VGFFNKGLDRKLPDTGGYSIDLLHRQGCAVCPLNRQKGLAHPHMPPSGNPRPDVLVIGEAPGFEEDKKGVPFVGKSGRFLRNKIPRKWESRLRFTNTVRTHPIDNRDPTHMEIECCRPSIVKDVEDCKPRAIFGLGNFALWWALADTGINRWRGRRIPIRVGDHKCWFFPMLHPSGILRLEFPKNEEAEFVFDWDLEHTFAAVDSLPDPIIHTVEQAQQNIEFVTGANSDDFKRAVAFIRKCYDYKIVGLDYETNRLRPYADGAKILSVALGHKDGAMAIPFDHPGTRFLPSQIRELKKVYEDFLYDAPCRKTAHQLSFEQEWSGYHFGPKCLRAQPWDDSVTQAYILDERPGTHSLDFLCLQYFGFNLKQISNVERERLEHEQLETVLRYNSLDAKYHRLLNLVQRDRIRDAGLDNLYDNHLRRVPTMVLTQLMGLPVDQKKVAEFYDKYTSDLEFYAGELETWDAVEKFERKKGRKFNPAAHMDVRAVMGNLGHFDLATVDEKELKKIDHPISELILEWRGAAKMLSTYVVPLMTRDGLAKRKQKPDSSCVYPDGLIHPVISTTRTRTSRTSSDDPNCFPPNVEVLTRLGWTRWDETDESDELAQYDMNTQQIDFVQPLEWIKHRHNGNLVNIKTQLHLDITCTENHNFILDNRLRNTKRRRIKLVEAVDITNDFRTPQAGQYIGGNTTLRDTQIILIGAFQADAYWSKKYGYIEWVFTRKRKQDRLRKALQAERIPFTERMRRKDQRVLGFYVARRYVPNWLAQKRHYGPWILNYTADVLKKLCDEIYHWDGGFTRKNEFCTGVEQDADWNQIMLILSNHRAAVRKRGNCYYTCKSNNNYGMTSNHVKSKVPYNGFVYCATMPKGTIIVRQNGCAIITGNSQNFPKHDGGKIIRSQIKHEYKKIVSFDFAGIQARNVAMESLDDALIDAFWLNYDIHKDWAEICAGLYPKWVTEGMAAFKSDKDVAKKYRQNAKNQFVFASFFGAHPKTTARALGVPEWVTEKMYAMFWKRFPKIRKWHEELKKFYDQNGYVKSLSGFRRHAPVSSNELINSGIQADETIIVCSAMTRLSEMEMTRFQASMEVHDDLTFIMPKSDIEKNTEVIAKEMTRIAFPWMGVVPIVIEMSIGDTWADMEEVQKFSSTEIWGHKRGTP